MSMRTIFPWVTRLLLAASLSTGLMQTATAQNVKRVQTGESQIIDAHNVCRTVRNRNSADLMVPIRNSQEWAVGSRSFLNSPLPGVDVRSCDYRIDKIASGPNGDFCGIDFDGAVWCWYGTFSGDPNYANSSASRTPTRVKGIPEPVESLSLSNMQSCAAGVSGKVYCWSAFSTDFPATYMGLSGIKDIGTTYVVLKGDRDGEITCGILLNGKGVRCYATLYLFGNCTNQPYTCYLPPTYTYTTTKTITDLHVGDGVGCFVEAGVLKCFSPMGNRDFRNTIRTVKKGPANIVEILYASLNDIVVQVSNNRLIGVGYDGEIWWKTFRNYSAYNKPSNNDFKTAAFSFQRNPTYGPVYLTGYSSTNSVLTRGAAWAEGRSYTKNLQNSSKYRETINASFRQSCGAVNTRVVQCRNQSRTSGGTIRGSTTFPSEIKAVEGTTDRFDYNTGPGYRDRPISLCGLGVYGGVWCVGQGYSGVQQMRFR